jgi:hypothetical protein
LDVLWNHVQNWNHYQSLHQKYDIEKSDSQQFSEESENLQWQGNAVNLSRLQIKVLDHFGNIIDLNNMDFSMTLELQLLYESFNFQNVTS